MHLLLLRDGIGEMGGFCVLIQRTFAYPLITSCAYK